MTAKNHRAKMTRLLAELRKITSEQKALVGLVGRQKFRFADKAGDKPESFAKLANQTWQVLLWAVAEQVNLREKLEAVIEEICSLEQDQGQDRNSNHGQTRP